MPDSHLLLETNLPNTFKIVEDLEAALTSDEAPNLSIARRRVGELKAHLASLISTCPATKKCPVMKSGELCEKERPAGCTCVVCKCCKC